MNLRIVTESINGDCEPPSLRLNGRRMAQLMLWVEVISLERRTRTLHAHEIRLAVKDTDGRLSLALQADTVNTLWQQRIRAGESCVLRCAFSIPGQKIAAFASAGIWRLDISEASTRLSPLQLPDDCADPLTPPPLGRLPRVKRLEIQTLGVKVTEADWLAAFEAIGFRAQLMGTTGRAPQTEAILLPQPAGVALFAVHPFDAARLMSELARQLAQPLTFSPVEYDLPTGTWYLVEPCDG